MSRPRCKLCTRRGCSGRCTGVQLATILGVDERPGTTTPTRLVSAKRRAAAASRRAARDAEYRAALGLGSAGPLPSTLGRIS